MTVSDTRFPLSAHHVYYCTQKGNPMLLSGGKKRGTFPAESLVNEDAKVSTSLACPRKGEKTQRQQVSPQGNLCCLCRVLDSKPDLLAELLTGDG